MDKQTYYGSLKRSIAHKYGTDEDVIQYIHQATIIFRSRGEKADRITLLERQNRKISKILSITKDVYSKATRVRKKKRIILFVTKDFLNDALDRRKRIRDFLERITDEEYKDIITYKRYSETI